MGVDVSMIASSIMPPPVARLINVHKAFGDQKVLNGVTLNFAFGRCTFIAGPSGTGKSVLVRHLVGLLTPDIGEAWYGDSRVDQMTPDALFQLRRRCVYVFQHPTLFDSMSVLENVSLIIRYHSQISKSDADKLAYDSLASLGLETVVDELPSHLSQGTQKRVSVARALALQPETLILDEPTTGLDPLAAYQIDQLVASLNEQGRTILIISHDIKSIRRLADDVIFMYEGQPLYAGQSEGFFSNGSSVIQNFISDDPV